MSDKTELAGLEAGELAELTLGLYFLFWSSLLFVLALTESLVWPALQTFSVIFLGGSGVGMVAGARHLHRVSALGKPWRRRTRNLLIATATLAYLSLFYMLWRRLPTNLYLLGHALAFFGLVIVVLGLFGPMVMQLARAAGLPNLAIQCVVFSVIAILLLGLAYVLVAETMVRVVRQGGDPFVTVQFWLMRMPLWTALLIFLPVILSPIALMLSLLWEAKGLALEPLLAKRSSPAQ